MIREEAPGSAEFDPSWVEHPVRKFLLATLPELWRGKMKEARSELVPPKNPVECFYADVTYCRENLDMTFSGTIQRLKRLQNTSMGRRMPRMASGPTLIEITTWRSRSCHAPSTQKSISLLIKTTPRSSLESSRWIAVGTPNCRNISLAH